MTPMQLLKKDHNAVKRLFTEFDRTTSRAVKKRAALVARIRAELEIHARIEAELFYRAMDEVAQARVLVQDAREEHQVVRELLDGIGALAPDAVEIRTRVKELGETVAQHAADEEEEMFPLAEQRGAEWLTTLAEQMDARRQELQEELAPRRHAA